MSVPTNTKTPSDVEILYARSILYQMLAFFFRHPAQIKDIAMVKSNALIWQDAIRCVSANDKLIQEFKKSDLAEWICEYERCFGHTVNTAAPAYELEYGEEHSHREPQTLADITAFYNAFGLKIAQNAHERADHVSVECEFMHYLLYKEAFAIEEGTEEQVLVTREASKNFLTHHLGYWLPSFARRLSKISEGIMQEAALFALEFVTEDFRRLGIQAGSSDLPIRTIQEKEETGCVSCSIPSHAC